MHYVIGDVHGCYDEMTALLAKIESMDPEAEIWFVGDFIDRGPKVWETLCWAMEHITESGRYHSVRGNHEQMAIDYIREYGDWYQWKRGTRMGEPESHYDIDKVLKKNLGENYDAYLPVKDFFESLPFHKLLEIETVWGRKVAFRIVHAYYEYGNLSEEEQQNSNLWLRIEYGNLESEEIMVHGHTPTLDLDYMCWDVRNIRPGMISYRKNDINIDGGCAFASSFPQYPAMLCAIRLEDLAEIYPCRIKDRIAEIAEKTHANQDPAVTAQKYEENYLSREPICRKMILRKMGCPDV